MTKKKKWIQKAVKTPGALTQAAKKAGMSMDIFCNQKNLSTKNKKRCALRETMMGFSK